MDPPDKDEEKREKMEKSHLGLRFDDSLVNIFDIVSISYIMNLLYILNFKEKRNLRLRFDDCNVNIFDIVSNSYILNFLCI